MSQVRSMEQVIAKSLDRNNFEMLLLSLFAGIALLLASIGIYGLISYSVEQRTQEIGIRMALGAGQGDMLKLVVWQGLNRRPLELRWDWPHPAGISAPARQHAIRRQGHRSADIRRRGAGASQRGRAGRLDIPARQAAAL